MTLIATTPFGPINIAFAIIGAAFGLYIGEKIRQYSPTASNAPGILCFACAVLSACFATQVLYALFVTFCLAGAAFATWHARPYLITLLQRVSGRLLDKHIARHKSADFERKQQRLNQDHQERIEAILRLDVHPDQQASLLQDEEVRYQNELRDHYHSLS